MNWSFFMASLINVVFQTNSQSNHTNPSLRCSKARENDGLEHSIDPSRIKYNPRAKNQIVCNACYQNLFQSRLKEASSFKCSNAKPGDGLQHRVDRLQFLHPDTWEVLCSKCYQSMRNALLKGASAEQILRAMRISQ